MDKEAAARELIDSVAALPQGAAVHVALTIRELMRCAQEGRSLVLIFEDSNEVAQMHAFGDKDVVFELMAAAYETVLDDQVQSTPSGVIQ
jgi:hypothetical protein